MFVFDVQCLFLDAKGDDMDQDCYDNARQVLFL